jgi:RNA recognition motif-containing protein
MRVLILLLSTLLLAEAWVLPHPLSNHRQVSRAVTTTSRSAEERRFAQAKTTKKYRGDAKLAEKYAERIKTAGRKGTKRFVDPCKVFVGNLPFTTDADQLSRFMLDTMGQARLVLHSSKIITDWKTGKSKGYGFVVFTDPIYATVAMEVVNGKLFDGRPVTVDQGKKKDQENLVYLKKKRNDAETDEELAITQALEAAESEEDEDGIWTFGVNDNDLELDARLFGLSGEGDDDDEYDGIFLERKPIYEGIDSNLNREKRREAARRMKRTKLPHKGFG